MLEAWIAIGALGAFHGLNPGMGWLFAVSNGMQSGKASGVLLALPPLAAGHLLAIAAVLLPVSLLSASPPHLHLLNVAAGLLLIGFGVYKLLNRRHPRFLARVGTRHLVLWSFLMASSHGAGLMVVPFLLDVEAAGMHATPHASHLAPAMRGGVEVAGLVTLFHTAIMVLTSGAVAWLVYRYLGLRLLQRSWFNIDLLWAASLVVVGTLALVA